MTAKLKDPQVVGVLEVDLRQHDVSLLVREARPVLLLDGNIVGGHSDIKMIHGVTKTTVKITFTEWISQNPYPFNDFQLLQKLFQVGQSSLSVREMMLESLSNEHHDLNHQTD